MKPMIKIIITKPDLIKKSKKISKKNYNYNNNDISSKNNNFIRFLSTIKIKVYSYYVVFIVLTTIMSGAFLYKIYDVT